MARQKVLLSALIGLVVVTAGWKIGKTMFYDPMIATQQKIKSLDRRLKRLHLAKRDQAPADQWVALASKALSFDPTEAKNVLTKQLTRLTMTNRLDKPRIQSRKLNVDKKTGVATLPVSVTAQGTLTSVTGFLGAVYELPYLVRVREVRLSPVGTRNSTTISMSVKIETLVMPRDEENKAFLPKEVATIDLGSDPKSAPRREPVVLAKAVGAYAAMDAGKPFHGFRPVPKPTPRPKRPVRSGSRRRSAKKPKKPPPPPPDPRGYTIVSTLLGWGGNLEVGLTNHQSKTRKFFKVGDELILYDTKRKPYDEGKIILIHAYGVVTQTGDGRRKLYPMGKRVSLCQPVNESTDPTIRAALAAADGT